MVHLTAFATFVDLRFDYGPIGLYAVIVVVEFAVGEKIAQKLTDAADRQLAARSNEKAEAAEQIEMAHIQDLRAADNAHQVEPNPLYTCPEMAVNTHSDWEKKLRNSHIKSGAVAGFQGQDSVGGWSDTEEAYPGATGKVIHTVEFECTAVGEQSDSQSIQMKPIGRMTKHKDAGNLSSGQFNALRHMSDKEDLSPKGSTSADEQDANAANAARIRRARKARLAKKANKQQSVGSDSDQPNASHLEKQKRLAKLKQQRSNVTKAQSKALKAKAEDVVIVDV